MMGRLCAVFLYVELRLKALTKLHFCSLCNLLFQPVRTQKNVDLRLLTQRSTKFALSAEPQSSSLCTRRQTIHQRLTQDCSCYAHQRSVCIWTLVANVPIRRAVNSLVIVPAVFKSHAHCVAVQVFVVSDVFAHGDFLFVVCLLR